MRFVKLAFCAIVFGCVASLAHGQATKPALPVFNSTPTCPCQAAPVVPTTATPAPTAPVTSCSSQSCGQVGQTRHRLFGRRRCR